MSKSGPITYEVVVGNIGQVHVSRNKRHAQEAYRDYVKMSRDDEGRAAGESVTLMADGEPVEEYVGRLDYDQDPEDYAEYTPVRQPAKPKTKSTKAKSTNRLSPSAPPSLRRMKS